MHLRAISYLLLGMFGISIGDTMIKMLSGDYALHQLVFIRAAISLILLMPVLLRRGITALRTSRPGMHALRGLMLVVANMTYFTGLASLPMAESSAVIFSAPVIITLLSFWLLGERFGVGRWVAVLVGLAGMVLVVQPFGANLESAYLWPLAAAFGYAGFTTLTRSLGRTESAALLAVSAQGSFFVASLLMGIFVGDGRFAGTGNPNLEFLLRAWRWPAVDDLGLIVMIGLVSAVIALSLSAAYRSAQASFLAPFEYSNLPLVLLWGYLVFGDFPNTLALAGIGLIAAGGMIMIFTESRRRARERSVGV